MIGSISNKDGKVLQVYQSNSLAFCPATALFLKVSSELYEKKLGNPYFVIGHSARVIWAQDQTEVVGGIVYEYVKESMAGNMILGFVSEPYRGKGIFGELQAIFEDEIRKLGGVRIYSQVHSLSNSQIRSMEKSGMDLYYYRMTRWIDDSLA
jgi:RimJ/RimL family protein N-acetyltransferase